MTLQAPKRRIKDWPFGKKLSSVAAVVGVGAILFYLVASVPSNKQAARGERRPAADFKLPDLNGRPRSLSDFKGQVVLLDFWATWCEPCMEELPDLIRFQDAHKDQNFTLVGVAMDAEGVSIVGPVARQNKIPYPILISGGDLPSGYNVPGFPCAFLIDRDGNIVRRYLGPVSYEELERDVSELAAAH